MIGQQSGGDGATGASPSPSEGAGSEERGPPLEDEGRQEEPAPPRPAAVSRRLLLLVTALNVVLALALLTARPPWRVESAMAPLALPAQVAQLQRQVERGERGAVYALTLTDDELTATAGYFLAQRADIPFSQVRLAVVDGHLEATGVTSRLAVAVPVRVQANVEARDGAPVVQVTDVGIGGVPLAAFARQQVLREANQAVDLSRYNLPVTVDSIALRSGALEARGAVK